jgi:hypothetical protein
VSSFNDARDAAVCPAINEYRQDIVDSGTGGEFGEVDERGPDAAEEPEAEGDAPAPPSDCDPTFGNTDIWSALVADPTP